MKKGMKISKIVTDKYKLRIPPTVYYDLLADVVEAEEEQEPKTGHWIDREIYDADRWKCSECGRTEPYKENFCPSCGCRMFEPQESEDKE